MGGKETLEKMTEGQIAGFPQDLKGKLGFEPGGVSERSKEAVLKTAPP